MSEAIPVHIFFLLDRSGSMGGLRSDVIGGFNSWLAAEKAKPGKCRLTLVQFDNQDPFEIVHDAVKLVDVPELTAATFVPRGTTPLLDAEGQLMVRAAHRRTDRVAAGKKPEAILVVTYTDGEENASNEWTYEMVRKVKATHESEEGWAFAYLGVGHDAYGQGNRIGTQSASTLSATADSAGIGQTYSTYTTAVSNVRSNAAQGRRTKSEDLFTEPVTEATSVE